MALALAKPRLSLDDLAAKAYTFKYLTHQRTSLGLALDDVGDVDLNVVYNYLIDIELQWELTAVGFFHGPKGNSWQNWTQVTTINAMSGEAPFIEASVKALKSCYTTAERPAMYDLLLVGRPIIYGGVELDEILDNLAQREGALTDSMLIGYYNNKWKESK